MKIFLHANAHISNCSLCGELKTVRTVNLERTGETHDLCASCFRVDTRWAKSRFGDKTVDVSTPTIQARAA
jgi:hypothetical protein